MENQITIIDPKEYGLEENNVSQIVEAFQPKIVERNELVKVYENVIGKELTPELVGEAKAVRLKLVKVRTGIAAIHKTQKEYFLSAGRYVDAWKNKETLPVTQMEEKLEEIENHFANIEKERVSKVKQFRESELSAVNATAPGMDLGTMSDEVYNAFLSAKTKEYNDAIEAERLVEEQRKEKELLDNKEQMRRFEIAQYAQFNKGDEDLRNMSDDDYSIFLQSLKDARSEFDAEQKRIAEENAKLKKEQELREAAIKKEREEAEAKAAKIAAENAAKLAEEKAAREAAELKLKQQAEQEAKAKADAEKEAAKLAKAPVKKQLNAWVVGFEIADAPTDNETTKLITEKFEAFKKWATEQVNNL